MGSLSHFGHGVATGIVGAALCVGSLAACGNDGEKPSSSATAKTTESASSGQTVVSSTAPIEPASDVTAATVAPSPATESTNDVVDTAPAAAELTIDSGFSSETNSIGTRQTSVGAIVTNPTDDLVACGVEVQFSLLDDAGVPFDTSTERIEFVLPRESAPVAPLQIGYKKPLPAELAATVVKVASWSTGDSFDACDQVSTLTGTVLGVANATVVKGERRSEVTGQVTNSSNTTVETSFIDCVLRGADGSVVGGETTAILDPVTPGGTIAFSLGLTVTPTDGETAECRVVA